ncbi:MAG: hypothetical protein LBM01_03610 [Christensenellaceae bacterium]|jgi:hypothetical protein|nr:hypothetical protein [Christensenellaceae bacterium]
MANEKDFAPVGLFGATPNLPRKAGAPAFSLEKKSRDTTRIETPFENEIEAEEEEETKKNLTPEERADEFEAALAGKVLDLVDNWDKFDAGRYAFRDEIADLNDVVVPISLLKK